MENINTLFILSPDYAVTRVKVINIAVKHIILLETLPQTKNPTNVGLDVVKRVNLF